MRPPPNHSANGHSDDCPIRRRRCLPTRLLCVVALATSIFLLAHTSPQSSHLWFTGIKTLLEAYHPNSPLTDIPRELPSRHILPSGDEIPSIAFGTAPSDGSWGKIGRAVRIALHLGYRHFDCAWNYWNEEEVGRAIRGSGIPREEVWITSKLWNSFHSPEDVEPALDDTLRKLGTSYLDLYLIHWPVAFIYGSEAGDEYIINRDLTEDPYPTWRAMESLVKKRKVRNIGVSNFNINRIKNLTANPLRIAPAVNQVELSYWNPQHELVEWSRANGLLLEAYSPLGSSRHVKESFQVPEVKEISSKLDITPAQVLLSWAVQRGTVVLSKSIEPVQIKENLRVVRLPEDLFNKLEKAAASHPPRRFENPSEQWGVGYDIFEWGN